MDQLRALRVFTQVISEGSFAGAARALSIDPAVVTRAVAELEAHLGARLLNRTTRKLVLTKTGEAYLERSLKVLSALDEADTMASSSTKQARGTLRVLCPPAFAAHQLVKHLPQFQKLHPQVDIELHTPGPVDAADANFDVSILSIGQQALEGDFVVRKLATSSFILCAAPSFVALHGQPTHPTDLVRFAGVMPAVSAVRHGLTLYKEVVDPAYPADGIVTVAVARPALQTNHIEVMLAAALAGAGVVGLPSFAAEQVLREGRLVRVLPGWRAVTLTLYAAIPSRKHLPVKTRAFVDFLAQAFGDPAKDSWLTPLKTF